MLCFQLLAVILFVSGSYALYDSAPDVVKLTPDNFEELVLNSTQIWIVMFYASWCGWSRIAVSEYSMAACALKGIAKLGAIDADKHYTFCQNYELIGYPTIRMFTNGKYDRYRHRRLATSYIKAVIEAAEERTNSSLNERPCKFLGDDTDSSSSKSRNEENIETTTEMNAASGYNDLRTKTCPRSGHNIDISL